MSPHEAERENELAGGDLEDDKTNNGVSVPSFLRDLFGVSFLPYSGKQQPLKSSPIEITTNGIRSNVESDIMPASNVNINDDDLSVCSSASEIPRSTRDTKNLEGLAKKNEEEFFNNAPLITTPFPAPNNNPSSSGNNATKKHKKFSKKIKSLSAWKKSKNKNKIPVNVNIPTHISTHSSMSNTSRRQDFESIATNNHGEVHSNTNDTSQKKKKRRVFFTKNKNKTREVESVKSSLDTVPPYCQELSTPENPLNLNHPQGNEFSLGSQPNDPVISSFPTNDNDSPCYKLNPSNQRAETNKRMMAIFYTINELTHKTKKFESQLKLLLSKIDEEQKKLAVCFKALELLEEGKDGALLDSQPDHNDGVTMEENYEKEAVDYHDEIEISTPDSFVTANCGDTTLVEKVAPFYIRVDDLQLHHPPDEPFPTYISLFNHDNNPSTQEMIFSSLIKRGHRWISAEDSPYEWLPTKDTEKLLQGSASNQKNIYVWSAKNLPYEGYGAKLPIVKARAVIEASPRSLMELLVDSDRAKEYNKLSLGRTDEYQFSSTDKTTLNQKTTCKITRSLSKPPIIRKPIEFLSLIVTTELLEQEGYLMVSRAVWESPDGTSNNKEDPSSKLATIRSEMILGVNKILLIREEDDCGNEILKSELVTVTQLYTPNVPLMIGKKVGMTAAYNYLRDIQNIFV